MPYINLKGVMNFVKLNSLKDCWVDKRIMQQKDFQIVMPKKIQDIQDSLLLHDPEMYGHVIASNDLL